MTHWFSCQIDGQTILQVKNASKKCRALCIASRNEGGAFSEHPLSDYPGELRIRPSLSKTREKHAFIIGGKSCFNANLSSCLRLDLAANEWETMPSLQVARSAAGSCSLKGFLYTFCGSMDVWEGG